MVADPPVDPTDPDVVATNQLVITTTDSPTRTVREPSNAFELGVLGWVHRSTDGQTADVVDRIEVHETTRTVTYRRATAADLQ